MGCTHITERSPWDVLIYLRDLHGMCSYNCMWCVGMGKARSFYYASMKNKTFIAKSLGDAKLHVKIIN